MVMAEEYIKTSGFGIYPSQNPLEVPFSGAPGNRLRRRSELLSKSHITGAESLLQKSVHEIRLLLCQILELRCLLQIGSLALTLEVWAFPCPVFL